MKCVLLGNDFLAVTSEGKKEGKESALEMFSGALGKMNLLAIRGGSGNLLGVKTVVACIRVASSLTKVTHDRIWCCFDETS